MHSFPPLILKVNIIVKLPHTVVEEDEWIKSVKSLKKSLFRKCYDEDDGIDGDEGGDGGNIDDVDDV